MEWLLNLGYPGLFIGTFLSGTVLPMSSDVLLVGMLAAGADPVACLLLATVGNWLGAMTSYWLGWFARWEWLERVFKVRPEALTPSESTCRPLRRVAGALFLGPGDRRGLHDCPGLLPRAAAHDRPHGTGRVVCPFSVLDSAAVPLFRPGIAVEDSEMSNIQKNGNDAKSGWWYKM